MLHRQNVVVQICFFSKSAINAHTVMTLTFTCVTGICNTLNTYKKRNAQKYTQHISGRDFNFALLK